MMRLSTTALVPALAAFALLGAASLDHAQTATTYPERPVRILVGWAPGDATDLLARYFGQKLSESFNQPFVIENRPGASSNIATVLAAKAASYRLRAEAADGMDLIARAQAARRAISHVRAQEGPFFLELKTYRFRAHSMYDSELYRPKDEIEAWKRRDPISLFEARLREAGP